MASGGAPSQQQQHHHQQQLNVQAFPRPPLVERCNKHIQIMWHGALVADCPAGESYWVLETHHPPTYYIPPKCVRLPLCTTPRSTFCEYKGQATYYSLMSPISAADTVSNRIWSYMEPMRDYEAIKGYIAFMVGPWECYVDGERATAQPGDFYGGWVTSNIVGVFKGPWATWDPPQNAYAPNVPDQRHHAAPFPNMQF
ncbi:hypothetical protein QBC47DRAFT_295510 [Echria macrotheca]|uniref:DUF427 domain-containing protein n=1 Tax=Echria macrotheca TaxID=438768 RepID=A0AAJ0F8M1_9PEZI|nr:hypothetical protein QBC47DRAFT_295510 [Echria macrotheca]